MRTVKAFLFLIICNVAPVSLGAPIFSFSFENDTGNTAGPIAGEIYGLIENGLGQSATGVVITNVGSHNPPFSLPYDVIANGWGWLENDFDVVNGQITYANFISLNTALETVIQVSDPFVSLFLTDNGANWSQTEERPTFSKVSTVPEPSPLPLMLLAAICIGYIRKKRAS